MAESAGTDIEERICLSRPISPCSAKVKGQKTDYSHKLTEKRRRDRMNISMSEIAQLLPSSSASKQLEKAEILEKTISYIKKLQDLTGEMKAGNKTENSQLNEKQNATAKDDQPPPSAQPELNSNYYSGFSDCIREVFHCLTNVEAMDLEQPCFQRLMGHLQNELQFMGEHREGNDSDKNHKNNSNNNVSTATTSLPPSKSSRNSWRRKRTHDNSANSSTPSETSSENTAAKRPHVDCSDSNGSSTSSETVSSSSKKEKRKVSLGTGCTSWNENRSAAHSNKAGSSVGSEKEKEVSSSALKQESNNMFDSANMDGGGCGTDSAGMNCNWPNLGLDMPIQATPLLPRTPYIPNPYTVPTYALHPAGTHYIPVVLHLSVPLPPFPEMNGRLNTVPNGGFGALNYLRMQFPYFPSGFPFAPQVNGIAGLNGVQIPKNESVQKQCESKPRDVDSTNIRHEHSPENESATRDLLNNID
ncbi:hypothetical protein ACROYT_G007013 [Oculina patagonica]